MRCRRTLLKPHEATAAANLHTLPPPPVHRGCTAVRIPRPPVLRLPATAASHLALSTARNALRLPAVYTLAPRELPPCPAVQYLSPPTLYQQLVNTCRFSRADHPNTACVCARYPTLPRHPTTNHTLACDLSTILTPAAHALWSMGGSTRPPPPALSLEQPCDVTTLTDSLDRSVAIYVSQAIRTCRQIRLNPDLIRPWGAAALAALLHATSPSLAPDTTADLRLPAPLPGARPPGPPFGAPFPLSPTATAAALSELRALPFVLTVMDKAPNTFVALCPASYHATITADLAQSSFYTPADPAAVAAALYQTRTRLHSINLPFHPEKDLPPYIATVKMHKPVPASRFIVSARDTPTTAAAKILTTALTCLGRQVAALFADTMPELPTRPWHVKGPSDASRLLHAASLQPPPASHAFTITHYGTDDCPPPAHTPTEADLAAHLNTLSRPRPTRSNRHTAPYATHTPVFPQPLPLPPAPLTAVHTTACTLRDITRRPLAVGPTVVSYDVERLFTNIPFALAITNVLALYDALRRHGSPNAIAFKFYTHETKATPPVWLTHLERDPDGRPILSGKDPHGTFLVWDMQTLRTALTTPPAVRPHPVRSQRLPAAMRRCHGRQLRRGGRHPHLVLVRIPIHPLPVRRRLLPRYLHHPRRPHPRPHRPVVFPEHLPFRR